MRDDWYGHRDPETFEPVGDKDEWLDVDYALLSALQTLEDYTDQHGLLIWEVQDPKNRVEVAAHMKIDPFEAAKEIKTSGKNYKKKPGEYYVPKLTLLSKEWPTMEEFIEHQIEEARQEDADKVAEAELNYQQID